MTYSPTAIRRIYGAALVLAVVAAATVVALLLPIPHAPRTARCERPANVTLLADGRATTYGICAGWVVR